jgi:hypothetical protein
MCQFLLCCLSQFLLQLQSVCSSILSTNCFIYTANNLHFILHCHHSVWLFRRVYVLLAIRLLMSFEQSWTIESLRVNYKSQLFLHAVDMFLAFEITNKTEKEMNFARCVKAGSTNLLQFHAFWYSVLDRDKCWVWRAGRVNLSPLHPGPGVTWICFQGGSEGHSACLETLEERQKDL